MKSILTILLLSITTLFTYSQEENVKTGWTFGALPAIAYDSDIGFRYGALTNLFYYGDGSSYPKYLHSIYYELSTTTKGSTLSKFYWDTDQLTKDYYLRLTASFNIIKDKAFDFYGFNGYQSLYNSAFEETESSLYRSRMFYRLERQRTNVVLDFQGGIIGSKLRWLGGYSFFDYQLGSVNIAKLNQGKSDADKLPSVDSVPGLYELYQQYNLFPTDEIDGGRFNLLKFGLVYDTRNIEANPTKGMWTELLIATAPSFLANKEVAFTKLSLIHRQYFTLVDKKLSLAYRIGYQQTIAGNAPHYVQPYIFELWPNSAYSEGIGGAKNVRGILRNRIVGDGIAYGNLEVRWKFAKTIIKKQNVYFALAPFIDGGMVTKEIPLNKNNVPLYQQSILFNQKKDQLHLTYGGGFYTAINENFIISVMHGRTFNKQDGISGFYININFLY